jgi:hypothetical protein
VLLTLFGFLGDIVKWTGAALLFVPARLGLIRQATTNEVLPVDFSTSPTSFFFPQAGQYALYTSDYDLLVITDTLIESGGRPWLVISSSDGKNLPVDFITRGLQPYDTPLAKGRPIYTFNIPSAGTYSISHPTRPSLTVYFVRDYVSGQEALHTSILVIESLGLIGLIAFFTYRRYGQKHRRLRAERAQKRQQVEAFWKERRQRQENATDGKPKSRWDDLG